MYPYPFPEPVPKELAPPEKLAPPETVEPATAKLATTYASLILADEGVDITPEKLQALIKASGLSVAGIYTSLWAKAFSGKDVKDLVTNAVFNDLAISGFAAPAAPAGKGKEEAKEEVKKDKTDS